MRLAQRLMSILKPIATALNILTEPQTKLINWVKVAASGFQTVATDAQNVSTVSLRGVGGWEHLYLNIGSLVASKKYYFSFDYQQISSTTTGSWTAFVLEFAPGESTEDNAVNIGKSGKNVFVSAVEQTKETITISFTATTKTLYLDLNFGRITDGQNVTLKFSNISLTAA